MSSIRESMTTGGPQSLEGGGRVVAGGGSCLRQSSECLYSIRGIRLHGVFTAADDRPVALEALNTEQSTLCIPLGDPALPIAPPPYQSSSPKRVQSTQAAYRVYGVG